MRILSRNGHDLTHRLPRLAATFLEIRANVMIDGEMVLPHADGRCDFYGLTSAIGDGRDGELLVWAFDLLWHTGEDLLTRPLLERKAALADIVEATGVDTLCLSAVFEDGAALLRAADRMGLEGVVSKRAAAPHRSGKCASWIKSKTPTWRAANRDRWRALVR